MSTILPDNLQVQLKMKGVELVKSQINQPAANFSAKEFQFTLNIETKLDPLQQLAFIIVSVDIMADGKPDILATISSACIFGIDNFEEVFKKISEDKYDTSDNVMFMLISISISTLRGIMHEQLRGTYLHMAFLPIVDPKQFKAAETNTDSNTV